jgi:hypothetical protein
MNTRTFTITLLIWLFSQQLIAAVSVISDVGMGCIDNSQSVCSKSTDKMMGHVMPTLNDSNTVMLSDQSMAVCDLCIAACQFTLILDSSISFIDPATSALIINFIPPPLDPIFSNTFRPPIFS